MAGLTIREIAAHDRPRERLFRLGPRALSEAELVALLLGQGRAGESALEMAGRLLAGGDGGGLHRLLRLSPEELRDVPGIGAAKAARLKAAVEIGRRLQGYLLPRRWLGNAREIAAYLMAEMRSLEEEHFRAVYLDVQNNLLGSDEVSVGDLSSAPAGAREIFRGAVRRGAAGIVLAHNHPGGSPRPSSEDLAVTRELIAAGELLGIPVLDHVVIGDGRYWSIRQEGPWPP